MERLETRSRRLVESYFKIVPELSETTNLQSCGFSSAETRILLAVEKLQAMIFRRCLGHFPHSSVPFLYLCCPTYTVFSSGSNGTVTTKAELPLFRLFVLIDVLSNGFLLGLSGLVRFVFLLDCHFFLRSRPEKAVSAAGHGPRVHQLMC